MKRTMVGIIVMGVFCGVALGQYGGGTGDPNDPYLIKTAAHMKELAGNSNDWGRPDSTDYHYFKLMADIDLSGPEYLNLQIGTDQISPFSGVFDGNGKTISGYRYELSPSTYGGLFGCVEGGNEGPDYTNFYSGIIKNLNLKDVYVKGGDEDVFLDAAVGGLVGKLAGRIEYCKVSGYVEGIARVGGLVGHSVGSGGHSVIIDSHSEANVKAADIVGGLVGWSENALIITKCSATGSVTGRPGSEQVGGFVGKAQGGSPVAVISECFATGNVTGSTTVGGFVGYCMGSKTDTNPIGSIHNCYARGSVSGGSAVGGFVGTSLGFITNSYSVGRVTGQSYVGGFAASGSPRDIVNSFWDKQTSGQSKSPGGGRGLDTGPMKMQSTYVSVKWDFETVWKIDEGIDYPIFRWQPFIFRISGHVFKKVDQGLEGVSISANNDGGSTVTDESGYYELMIPEKWSGRITPSKTKYKFIPEYRDYTSLAASKGSQDFIAQRQLPPVRLTKPNGGETYFSAIPCPVGWTSTEKDPAEQIHLEYSDNNGTTWNEIGVTDNRSPYPWTTPYLNSNQYLVRISWDERPDLSDKSDSTFTVYACNTVLRGDLNDDCYVNMEDLKLLVSSWMNTGDLPLDLDGDSHVNQNEFALVASSWLRCGNPFDPACEGGLADFESIPQGTNQLGSESPEGYPSEQPARNITIDAFRMDAYEITNRQYAVFLNASLQQEQLDVLEGIVQQMDGDHTNPYYYTSHAYSDSMISFDGSLFIVLSNDGRNTANDPVVGVTWFGAVAYCNWRSQIERKDPCYDLSTWMCDFTKNGYRLPTEAEWEYSARGGLSGKRFSWGDTISHSHANYYSFSYYDYDISLTSCFHPWWNYGSVPFTSPVGSFSPNGFGLYDIVGNVSEWCNDWYATWYYSESPTNNPTGPDYSVDPYHSPTGGAKVIRGGGWNTFADSCRVSYREGYLPGSCGSGLGFRIMLPK